MCSNRIEEKTGLRSFHLGQDISIPYLKINALNPCAEIDVSNVVLKKKKQQTKKTCHTKTQLSTPVTQVLNY